MFSCPPLVTSRVLALILISPELPIASASTRLNAPLGFPLPEMPSTTTLSVAFILISPAWFSGVPCPVAIPACSLLPPTMLTLRALIAILPLFSPSTLTTY